MGDKKKKQRRGRSKRKFTAEKLTASRYVHDWVFRDPAIAGDGFAPESAPKPVEKAAVFEFHSHSRCSDGYLSPSALVERAHAKGVKVLALTDHDTMAGIPEAVERASKFGIRIIPGVEISAVCFPSEETGTEEHVHILAYYGGCGPSRYDELDKLLSSIRDGRYIRAKNMLSKLNALKMPLNLDHVVKIAGNGVAPGRLHVARAMVEAGHVENLKQAFSRYLYDGGPAYAMGSEPSAETVVKLIHRTGGVSALAHPWALKNPIAVVRSLRVAGLHAIEVYRSDGKLAGFSDLADTYQLLKIGGSDYHAKGGHEESDLGSVSLPIFAVYEFLKLARPIWCEAIKDNLLCYAEEPSDTNFENLLRFGKMNIVKGSSIASCGEDLLQACLSSWLTKEERETVELDSIREKLSHAVIADRDSHMGAVTR